MKRNETILVYSVTGLLVVILGVAIAFGDGGVRAGTSIDLKTLDDLQDVVATAPDAGDLEARGTGARGALDGTPGTKSGDGMPEGSGPRGSGPQGSGQGTPAIAPVSDAPLVVPVAPAPTDAATRALVLLGESSRDGAYRVVSVRHGDTFSQLVQRWCGSLEQMDVAASLNEEFDLGRLEPATRLYLPWVDDEVLLAALERRKSGAANPPPSGNGGSTGPSGPSRTAPLAGAGEEYKVKPGDKLWNIAVARVGAGKASKFIEAVRDLNPELRADPDRLAIGKTIVLPR